jgi:hypothetical protein
MRDTQTVSKRFKIKEPEGVILQHVLNVGCGLKEKSTKW